MSDEIATIDYCPELPMRSDIVLRRIVGWFAIVHSSLQLINFAVHILLEKGMITIRNYPTSPSSSTEKLVMLIAITCTGMMLIGGIKVVLQSEYGPLLLRIASFVYLLIASIYMIVDLFQNIGVRYQFSSIYGVFSHITAQIGFWSPPLIVFLLTLPSLAKRIK